MRNLLQMALSCAMVALFAVACEDSQAPLSTPSVDDFPETFVQLEPSTFEPGEASVFSNALTPAASMGGCNIADDGVDTWTLNADCATTTGVVVPDGYTFDLNKHTVTGTGDFQGGIVTNDGTEMHVTNGTIAGPETGNALSLAGRLRGVLFEGASGSATMLNVLNIHRGPTGSQEGNAIEVRNAPFDGTHPNIQVVTVAHNVIADYQKSGIVANGDVDVLVEHNDVRASAAQAVLAANTVQLGFGATGAVQNNKLDGNQWLGASNFAATAILVFEAQSVNIDNNLVRGNSDVGVFAIADSGVYEHNDVRDFGDDGPHGDFGIADLGFGNTFDFNKVCGFDSPFFPADLEGKNGTLPEQACS